MSYRSRIGLFLFGSGFCALVYQIVWLRMLRLVFGGSTPASATVLAIFMAGLGIGGLLLGRRSEASENPLGFYARLEIGISIAAALSVFLIAGVRALYIELGGTATLGLFGGTLLRLVLATLVLGIPTFLMGGTLPATVRAATTGKDLGRHTVGLLYAINTIGAVAGAWVTTFYLIELLGIRQTLWLAAALNLLIAIAARSQARGKGMAEPGEAGHEAGDRGEQAPKALYRMVLLAAAGVGFVFFLLELVWYRMMGPILGGSTYTFGIVLAVALAGIGLGGFLYGLAAQGRRPSPLEFAATCSLEALAVAIPFALGDRLAFLALKLRALSIAGFGALTLGWTTVTLCVVFPAAVIAGYQFPLLVALLGSGRRQIATQVGRTYAWNTFGAIVGSIAGGFVLLPLLTAPVAWKLSIWILCGIAGLFLVYELGGKRLRVLPVGLVALVALALTAATGPTAFWRHSGIGAGRMRQAMSSPNELRDVRHASNRGLNWEVEGRESSVALIDGSGFIFVVNGKADGSARVDAPTQVMSGLVGTALHPDPKETLVVGLGTGSSAGWMAKVPGVESVEVVELEPAILDVAEACSPVNEDVLRNPKVEIVIADAREHLLTVKSSYDVIFSEPSNPYRAGISSLFTREFYQAVQSRLSDDGLFVQWLQAYDVDAQVVRTAYATLSSVFPYVETWQVHVADLLLIGSQTPIDHSAARLENVLGREPYARALNNAWGLQGIEGFYSGFLANTDFAKAVADLDLAAINTDDHPVIEFGFARSVGKRGGFKLAELRALANARGQDRPPGLIVDWNRVDEAREARNVMFLSSPAPIDSDDPSRQARSRARRAYAKQNFKAAFDGWTEQSDPPTQPVDRIALTESAAYVGSESLPALFEDLSSTHPVEAGLAKARWHLVRGETAAAAQSYIAALEHYRTNPWPNPSLTKRALSMAHDLKGQDPELAPDLLAALAQPFSVRMHDQQRLGTILNLVLPPDQEICTTTFGEFEPFVPWIEPFLRARRDCYSRFGHPLAARAQADLESFYSASSIPLWRGLKPEEELEAQPIETRSTDQASASD
ncbi:MAG: fused MFS/spermidine synthase [Acidobacteriota bacterium]|nr:fused MFS/spermidine synthase [Acidobacteriota bacterium]